MRTRTSILVTVLFCLVCAGPALAGEEKVVTLEGDIVCAKCTLKVEGMTECQDVLKVAKEGAEPALYFIAKNEVSEAVGHVCMGTKPVEVTGVLKEKEGKTWITAKKMKEIEKS